MLDFKLAPLFAGGAEPWLARLGPILAGHPDVGTFLGPERPETIVPLRELTFQALKANPAHRWKVVAFGQNPYPRVESATGIAMFDNSFRDWGDVQFGRVTSIRCLVRPRRCGSSGSTVRSRWPSSASGSPPSRSCPRRPGSRRCSPRGSSS